MRAGSLFSGIGGLDLGFDRAGFGPAYQVEIDERCRAVLAKHWPTARRFDDITTVASADIAGADIITGGFPCQDVSVAGRRAGLTGERSGLWFEFHRVLADHRPRWCVIENVPGLLTSNDGRDFATVLGGLVELGYGVAWRVLDAQYFGVAQRRRRVFVVGSHGDYACAEVLFESEGLPGNPPARGEAREVIAKPLGGSTQSGGYRTTDLDHGAFIWQHASGGGDDPKDTAQSLRAAAEHSYQIVYDARGNGPGDTANAPVGDHMNRVTDYTPIVASPLRSRSAVKSNRPGRGGEDDENLVSYWDGGDIADTLDASQIAKGQMMPEKRRFPVVVGPAVRRLTPLECERLQGFPDGWTEGHSDTTRYRMLGNAVAVPVAEWIARRIRAAEEGTC